MQFEWDADKAALNLKKHGVDFRDAVRVFYDVNRIEWYDSAHSDEEGRYNKYHRDGSGSPFRRVHGVP